jgi:integrase/recombinase XerD
MTIIPLTELSSWFRTFLDAYRDSGDAATPLALLSTYLGHIDPGKTYWYLSAAPELLQLASARLERHLGSVA